MQEEILLNLSYYKGLKKSQMNNCSIILLGIIVGIFIGLGSITRGTDLFGLFFLIIYCFIFMTILFKVKDPVLRNILIIAFALRTELALFNAFISPLPDSGADAISFERIGGIMLKRGIWAWKQTVIVQPIFTLK